MDDTLTQIEGAAGHSLADVNVSITSGGSIVGQGVTVSAGAIRVCGGHLDNILRSFGGVQGGDVSFGGKAASVVSKTSTLSSKLSNDLEKKLVHVHELASDLESFAALAKDAVENSHSEEHKEVLKKIVVHVDEAARSIRGTVDKEVNAPKQKAEDFIERNAKFLSAIKSLGAHLNDHGKAGMLSLSFSSVNELKKLGREVSEALKVVDMKKSEYLGKSLVGLDAQLTQKIADNKDSAKLKELLTAWSVLLQNNGHKSELDGVITGGASTTKLVDRLNESRKELRTMINKFVDAFGININGIVASSNELSEHLGKDIPYSDDAAVFLDTFDRLSEYLNHNVGSIYQHLLELNTEQVDSKEIKARFLSSMRDLAERCDALGSKPSVKSFSQHCRDVINTVNRFSDMIKTHRDNAKKEGGSTESMNELFSVDASKIDINGLRNPLENLKIAIKKIQFMKNVAVFRSNLQQTNKELAVYSKDYTKSVGQAIGEAITKIKNEYTEIINQISDNKTGMGLEIDMYNESKPNGDKISKEKLKMIYKWQCDARVGLYKTVEAIDLYLLHFTESITKNPDAVADLHKMLSATKIIAKWYDTNAGNNLIRMFESFADPALNVNVDADNFIAQYAAPGGAYNLADLEDKVGGDRANKIYERTRRAVEGVVVLKNIISYFISIGEKYGDFKSEKNIYMAPSNIYKNLVNYLWVSALDVNTTGSEVLTDNNETKRLLTYEDTKVKIAEITTIDPEVMGINFNKHSIDKLRIMKCHNELLRLKDFTASMTGSDVKRVQQFVAGVFARLGKTEYIFEMLSFGVYDLSQMDKPMIRKFLAYALDKANAGGGRIDFTIGAAAAVTLTANYATTAGAAAGASLLDAIAAISPNQRTGIKMTIRYAVGGDKDFIHLQNFVTSAQGDLNNLNAMDIAALPANNGFMTGFLKGLTNADDAANDIGKSQRAIASLHYCIMNMLEKYKESHSSSVFAIDDTYFILTLKAIAGKVMATTGVNALFKKPDDHNTSVMKSQTRLIMGGAEGDVDIIDDAVELYVRLPLLVEFYRDIFDNGNKKFKDGSVSDVLDEEQVSYVPEIGNVWSGLIINIFDKSKHIDNGIYSMDNMRKIVSEVNSIYKHFKGSVPADQLVRHVMVELVAEINRRYGIIKRQELLNYYNAVNATKQDALTVEESNYSNNDYDILNEAEEFEDKSPSDEFIKFKSSITDPSTPKETKISRLTDYTILKQFRGKIDHMMGLGNDDIRNGVNGPLLSIVERVRMLKKAIVSKTSREAKYDMIIKAIEESESMNQSSNDIFVCFHELVLTPLRTAYHMHRALDLFLINVYTLLASAKAQNIAEIGGANPNMLFNTKTKLGSEETTIDDAIKKIAKSRYREITFNSNSQSLLIGGHEDMMIFYDTALNVRYKKPTGDNTRGPAGEAHPENVQLLLINTLIQFATNSDNLVKLNISTTNRITIDFTEYQKVCEYLIANVKFMVDKFTGLVPSSLIDKVSNREKGGIYWLEEKLVNQMFNKLNKTESKQSVYCMDTLNKLMPIISKVIFDRPYNPVALLDRFALHTTNYSPVQDKEAMPVIRDAFMQYNNGSKMYMLSATETYISQQLFNAHNDSSLTKNQLSSGIVQEYNILISQYLNHMYDAQSRKIYTKAFATFAGSALVDAINGQSFPDFSEVRANVTNINDAPSSQVVLSSTLAYVMKTLSNRVNPTTGMKIHEITSLEEVSPQVLERYRTMIPMYLRIFKLFVKRCKLHRKIIGNIQVNNRNVQIPGFNKCPTDTNVKENVNDQPIVFAHTIDSLNNKPGSDVKDAVNLYLDEIVNSMSSLIQDVENVQKELLETDTTVSLYFDMKKDFTKNYFSSNKELPFAPLSILMMGMKNMGNLPAAGALDPTRPPSGSGIEPLYDTSTTADHLNNKFLYGLRTLLIDDFKLSSSKVPYLKSIINDFNGYTTASNNITESKFNDVLSYVGRAMNYLYDLRFFNGKALTHADVFAGQSVAKAARLYSNTFPPAAATNPAAVAAAAAATQAITTDRNMLYSFQEINPKNRAMTLIESVNILDSRNKIADYIKSLIVNPRASPPIGRYAGDNPRTKIIIVNLVDLNIMPINVHSLMREIPLANLYNYAMTFDAIVEGMTNIDVWEKTLLKKPYSKISVNGAAALGGVPALEQLQIDGIAGVRLPHDSRFIKDVLINQVMRIQPAAAAAAPAFANADERGINQRLNSKIYHNLMFLTLIQKAIKQKVKTEMEFINTRVVNNTNAINDTITDATVNRKDINDDLFEF